MNDFKYDVIICTYNGEKYIRDQIKSIIGQENKPANIILSDDGSTDYTLEIVKSLFHELSYTNYRIINGPRKGVTYNFLQSLIHSTSEYVLFSDQDDIWLDNKIELYKEETNKYSTNVATLYFSDSLLIDEIGEITQTSFFEYQNLDFNTVRDGSILYQNCVQGATIMINSKLRDVVLKSLNIINIDNIAMHDWWIAVVASSIGRPIFVSEPTIKYRQHGGNLVGARRKRNLAHNLIYVGDTIDSLKIVAKQIVEYRRFKEKSINIKDLTRSQTKSCSIFKRVILNAFAFYYSFK
ncbi:glycosyltransferase family 2 protein [Vibrio cholerae]|uniref:glycosyltransferase family 2 protein n=1 Tax=Vibrio cholerae TaxID=666 RepID=UPI0006E6F13C|nr:glycosyltransferase family 2 protein [Vibrio cholerae]EGR2082399.1 glycosyltransferase family 2 protein [Vibrio cholerae]EGR4062113.1 glycosyltransferase family 2 protein [Vibrio cholerae]EGR4421111.1 glycosyltransferase family 2 protein [Vibrio cholerae]EGR4432011.1 glycosyltransferase family 2 protein [Vibrio cholerae]ELF6477676.1 glycosyltransferase family 2 protein [Vibrio cholerae]